MPLLTESEFKSVIPPGVQDDPLVDCHVYDLIHSYNQFNNLNERLKTACRIGPLEFVNAIINQALQTGFSINFSKGLESACQGGHTDIVQFMIDKGADNWDCGLEGAC